MNYDDIDAKFFRAYESGDISEERLVGYLGRKGKSSEEPKDHPTKTKTPRSAGYVSGVASSKAKSNKESEQRTCLDVEKKIYPNRGIIHSDEWSITQTSPRYLVMRTALRRAELAWAIEGDYDLSVACCEKPAWWAEYEKICNEHGVDASRATFENYVARGLKEELWYSSNEGMEDCRRRWYSTSPA